MPYLTPYTYAKLLTFCYGQAFLNRIFVADPAQRATLEALKSHEWLAGDVLSANDLYVELLQRKR